MCECIGLKDPKGRPVLAVVFKDEDELKAAVALLGCQSIVKYNSAGHCLEHIYMSMYYLAQGKLHYHYTNKAPIEDYHGS